MRLPWGCELVRIGLWVFLEGKIKNLFFTLHSRLISERMSASQPFFTGEEVEVSKPQVLPQSSYPTGEEILGRKVATA